jgi:hypothetical protein
MKFYGKSAELENTVRDGNLSHDLNEFLDKMDSLKEAIAFFSSHSTYQNQIENMVSFSFFFLKGRGARPVRFSKIFFYNWLIFGTRGFSGTRNRLAQKKMSKLKTY